MIKTWNQRCEEHPDHQTGMVSERMIQSRMQEEIEDLRAALAEAALQRLTNVQQEIEAALEQPEQEPVAWMHKKEGLLRRETSRPKSADWDADHWTPLYPAPPAAQQRKPLTWEQISQIGLECANDSSRLPFEVKLARAIEAAHGIKGEV